MIKNLWVACEIDISVKAALGYNNQYYFGRMEVAMELPHMMWF